MDRDKIIRIGADLVVASVAAWVVKEVGLKQGSILAAVAVVLLHEMLDAPVAARLRDVI